jgi:phosphate/sulfate permease
LCFIAGVVALGIAYIVYKRVEAIRKEELKEAKKTREIEIKQRSIAAQAATQEAQRLAKVEGEEMQLDADHKTAVINYRREEKYVQEQLAKQGYAKKRERENLETQKYKQKKYERFSIFPARFTHFTLSFARNLYQIALSPPWDEGKCV